jgi:hypothetical protein
LNTGFGLLAELVAFSMFGLRRAFLLATGLAPAAGLTFLCFAKEKISKRKASQRPWPFGLPCATRVARGRAQTRYAQTSARPDPRTAALLSTANGQGSPNTACARSLRSPCTRFLARCARCIGSRHFRHNKHNRTHRRSHTNHQSIHYDRIVPQSGPTNPPRSAPIQKHLSKTKKPNWVFKLPFTPAGVKGRGGSGG